MLIRQLYVVTHLLLKSHPANDWQRAIYRLFSGWRTNDLKTVHHQTVNSEEVTRLQQVGREGARTGTETTRSSAGQRLAGRLAPAPVDCSKRRTGRLTGRHCELGRRSKT
jgi:hypothetical protein